MAMLRRLGVWPSYYLRYFYEHDHVVEQQRTKPSRAAEVAEIERQLLEMYADPAVDEKPELLQQRGGAYYSEAAVDLMASLITDRGDVQVVERTQSGHAALPCRSCGGRGAGADRPRRPGATSSVTG